MSVENTKISETHLWDPCDNEAWIQMFHVGGDTYELWYTHMNAVPTRFRGPLNLCLNKSEHWFFARKSEGFVEQPPSYNPSFWKA